MSAFGKRLSVRLASFRIRSFMAVALFGKLSVVSGAAQAADVAYKFSYNGRLISTNGNPVEGPVALSVSFYHTAEGGSPVLTVTEGLTAVPLQEGVFQISLLLSGTDLQAAFPGVSQAAYIEVTDLTNRPNDPYDRQLVAMMPYAAKIPVDGSTLEFNSQGQLTAKASAASGQLAISAINAASGGTISATRLPTLAGDVSGSVNAATVVKLQGRPLASTEPNDGEYLKWNGSAWIPAGISGTEGGTVTSVSTGKGLGGGPVTATGTIDLRLSATGGLSKELGTGSDELGIAVGGVKLGMLSTTGCTTDGKVLKVSSGVWSCGDDMGLASGAIANADIATSAGIVDSKLATITSAGKVADSALSASVTKLGGDIELGTSEVAGTLPAGKGGTGATSLTGIVVGNGTSAMTAVPGSANQFLRRNAANDAYEFVSLGDAATKNTGTGSTEVAAGNHTHAAAVAGTSSGFMSATDKTTLDSLSTNALVDSDFTSEGFIRRGSSAGSYSVITDNSTNWNAAYADRMKWDGLAVGGGSGPELATARAALGLGSMAMQSSSNVAITGGTISGVALSMTGISDGADATAITIDSSERVGIGTTSPDLPLTVISKTWMPPPTSGTVPNGALRLKDGTGVSSTALDLGTYHLGSLSGTFIDSVSATSMVGRHALALNPRGGTVAIGFLPDSGNPGHGAAMIAGDGLYISTKDYYYDDQPLTGSLLKIGHGSSTGLTYASIEAQQGNGVLALNPSGGKVGIGTSIPAGGLDVQGQIRAKSSSQATGAIDWNNGNAITTSYNCASSLTFSNLLNGGSYTLAVTDSGTTQCNFSTSTSGSDAATVTYRYSPANAARTASSHTIYSMQRIGTVVYVSWISGF